MRSQGLGWVCIPRQGFWLRGMSRVGETAKHEHPSVRLLASGDAVLRRDSQA
ncbi:MAG: hypothetical protein II930_07600 [Lachnospiraceae bacterium]|nr:hypothetical protein [Lachnospiraceae bacterium]